MPIIDPEEYERGRKRQRRANVLAFCIGVALLAGYVWMSVTHAHQAASANSHTL